MTKKHYKSGGLRIFKPLAIDIFARPWQIKKIYGNVLGDSRNWPWPELHHSSCKAMFPTCVKPGLISSNWPGTLWSFLTSEVLTWCIHLVAGCSYLTVRCLWNIRNTSSAVTVQIFAMPSLVEALLSDKMLHPKANLHCCTMEGQRHRQEITTRCRPSTSPLKNG